MAEPIPTFDIPGMGRMTAAEFADAYNAGRVPASLATPGGTMVVRDDGRTVGWAEPAFFTKGAGGSIDLGGGVRATFGPGTWVPGGVDEVTSFEPVDWTPRPQPPFASLFEPRRYRDPLFYIGATPC